MSGRKRYIMTLKEMNRLESNCSATSSINALRMVRCLPYLLPWPWAMAMPEHPYSCTKPLKHESCDTRNALTNPQSYCGEYPVDGPTSPFLLELHRTVVPNPCPGFEYIAGFLPLPPPPHMRVRLTVQAMYVRTQTQLHYSPENLVDRDHIYIYIISISKNGPVSNRSISPFGKNVAL